MSRKTMVWLLAFGMYLCCGIGVATAQENSSAADMEKGPAAYRLDFSLYELEDGKKLNTRQYSMNVVEGVQFQELKIGTRVPIEMKQGDFQYLEVGTNISARLQGVKSALNLEVRADISNFAVADQEQKGRIPVLRQLRISGATIVTAGKPIVIGLVDDPSSKRQFQLEVVVAKMK